MKIFLVFVFLLTFLNGIVLALNPYEILGVNRYASIQEIRKAYKQLAKEW